VLLTSIDYTVTRQRPTYAATLAGFLGLAIAMGVGRFAFTPVLPLMQADAGLSVSDGAWLSAANYLGYLVGALAAMALTGSAVVFIRAGIAVIAAATFAMAVTASMPVWFAMRFVAGVASAFLLVFVSAWSLEHITSTGRAVLSGVIFGGVGAGIFIVGVVCLGMERLHADSGEVWMVLGVLSVALGIAAWPLFSGSARSRESQAQVASDNNNAPGGTWRLVLSYGLLGFGYIVPATFLPVMARALVTRGASLDVSWPVFGLAACVSTIVAARMSSRYPEEHVWRVAQAVMAVGIALPAFVTAPGAVIAAALCVGGTFMVVTMAGMQTAKRLGGASATRLMALMTAAFATGQLAGPLTVPFLIRPGADFSIVLGIAALALLLGSALVPRRSTHD
jgi:MFS family permease